MRRCVVAIPTIWIILILGHCQLKLSDTSQCRGCEGEDETIEHILCDCPALASKKNSMLGTYNASARMAIVYNLEDTVESCPNNKIQAGVHCSHGKIDFDLKNAAGISSQENEGKHNSEKLLNAILNGGVSQDQGKIIDIKQ